MPPRSPRHPRRAQRCLRRSRRAACTEPRWVGGIGPPERGVRVACPSQRCCRFSRLACEPPQNPRLRERAACTAAPQDLGAACSSSPGVDTGRFREQRASAAGPLSDGRLPTAIPATSYSACHLAMQYRLASGPRLRGNAAALLHASAAGGVGLRRAAAQPNCQPWRDLAGHSDCILRLLGERSVATRARMPLSVCCTAWHGAVLSGRLQPGWPYRGPRSEPPPRPGWVPLQASGARS